MNRPSLVMFILLSLSFALNIGVYVIGVYVIGGNDFNLFAAGCVMPLAIMRAIELWNEAQ